MCKQAVHLCIYHIMIPLLKASFKCICLASAHISGYAKKQAEMLWLLSIFSPWSRADRSTVSQTLSSFHRENTTSRAQQQWHQTRSNKNIELLDHWSPSVHSYRGCRTQTMHEACSHILQICSWQNAEWRQIYSLSRYTNRWHRLWISHLGRNVRDIKLGFSTLKKKTICSNGNRNERPLSFTETICVLEKFSPVNILLSKKTTLWEKKGLISRDFPTMLFFVTHTNREKYEYTTIQKFVIILIFNVCNIVTYSLHFKITGFFGV